MLWCGVWCVSFMRARRVRLRDRLSGWTPSYRCWFGVVVECDDYRHHHIATESDLHSKNEKQQPHVRTKNMLLDFSCVCVFVCGLVCNTEDETDATRAAFRR